MRDALQERGRVILELFERRCREAGIAGTTAMPIGVVANEICDHARTADVIVLGHRGINERFSTGLLGSTTESVARKAPRPVLVSPQSIAPRRGGPHPRGAGAPRGGGALARSGFAAGGRARGAKGECPRRRAGGAPALSRIVGHRRKTPPAPRPAAPAHRRRDARRRLRSL